MKKTTCFIVTITICSLCILSFVYYLSKQGDFTVKDISGDPTLLQDVSFDTNVVINDSYIPISNTNNKDIQYSLRINQLPSYDSYDSLSYFPNEETKPITDWKNYESENISVSDDMEMESRNLNKIDIYYEYNQFKQNSGFILELGMFKTDLWYEASDSVSIQQINTKFYDSEFVSSSIMFTDQNNEELPNYSVLTGPIYYKGYYYLLPPSNAYMKGQNYIYKAKLLDEPITLSYTVNDDMKETFDNPNYTSTISTEKLTKVTMGRNYITMLMVNEQFYVFSELNNTLYVTVYDLDGNYVNEWEYKNQGIDTIFQNDSYICWEYQTNLYVLDTKTMKIVDQGTIHDINIFSISDLYYHNNNLYVSYFDTSTNNYISYIQVIRNNKSLYHGVFDFSKTKSSQYDELMFYQTDVKFRR